MDTANGVLGAKRCLRYAGVIHTRAWTRWWNVIGTAGLCTLQCRTKIGQRCLSMVFTWHFRVARSVSVRLSRATAPCESLAVAATFEVRGQGLVLPLIWVFVIVARSVHRKQ